MKEMLLKRKKQIIIICSIFLCAVIAISIAIFRNNSSKNASGIKFDSNAVAYEKDVDGLNDDSNGISIPGYSDIMFPANEKEVPIVLWNPDKNTCLFQFQLYIDGDNEPIAETGFVKPGTAVQEITLNKALEAGKYNLNIKVNTYKADTYDPLNDAVVKAKLQVVS